MHRTKPMPFCGRGMDTDLVVQAQRGDKGAYALVATEIADRFLAVARRILRDLDLAEDATQGALLAIWQDLPQLRGPADLHARAYPLRPPARPGRRDPRRPDGDGPLSTSSRDACAPGGTRRRLAAAGPGGHLMDSERDVTRIVRSWLRTDE